MAARRATPSGSYGSRTVSRPPAQVRGRLAALDTPGDHPVVDPARPVMADPRLQPDANPMPFDRKRLIYGGFEVIADA